MISKVLVANRGEIAQRVIRTVHDMGRQAVAVYSDTDRDAAFVAAADEAYALGGENYVDTYLNIARIIELAQQAGADAIHPGYGFLSEIAEFADAVLEAGLTWIGPSPSVLSRLGDKIQARRLAEAIDVSPIPGLSEAVQTREQVDAFVARFGFPIVTKKSDGGGGRGISVHNSDADLDRFFTARDEGSEYFVERFIGSARHIETQCARDSHGQFVVISTRDCSVQRRNQKMIEEAPAPQLPGNSEQTLVNWSRKLFEAVDYIGLGTCEFLVEPDGRVNFLEVNPRLQVEHTITEEVAGLDLVREQILIAEGGRLSPLPTQRGHSFEFRITCEDPARGLVPSTGVIEQVVWPLGHGVRIESGISAGDTVTSNFDPMLAKLIVTAPDREQAIARSIRALRELRITGVATPAELYIDLIGRPDFVGHVPSTRWFVDEILPTLGAISPQPGDSPAEPQPVEYLHFTIELDGKRTDLAIPAALFTTSAGYFNGAPAQSSSPSPTKPSSTIEEVIAATPSGPAIVEPALADGNITAAADGTVGEVFVTLGQRIEAGKPLLSLEIVGGSVEISAPKSGHVAELDVEAGDQVQAGQRLLKLLVSGKEEFN